MFSAIRAMWSKLRESPAGERFEKFHEEQRSKPRWVRLSYVVLAILSFAVGVVLAFIPGPAVVFFALTAALLATQSLWVARRLDKGELKGRELVKSLRAWWRSHGRRRLRERNHDY